MEFTTLLVLVAIAAVAFLINVPLGRLRARQPKLSFKWFVYVHLSIPLIYGMRTCAGIGLWAIPILISAAVAGQIIGGR